MAFTLLVVDDSRVSRMMIKARVLAAHPDWTVLEAASGDEAVPMVSQQVVHGVTMDVNMPGLNGFDAAVLIKHAQPHLPVVMLTANIQESSHARAKAEGVCFVQKPITDASMRQVMAYLTESP